MPIEGSRGALFSCLALFTQLVNCGFWGNVAWTQPENLDPGNSPQPDELPPSPAIVANQSVQPSPIFSSDCQATVSKCTIKASVSSDSVPFFSPNSKMKSVSLFILLAARVYKHCLSSHGSQPTLGYHSLWIKPVNFPFELGSNQVSN